MQHILKTAKRFYHRLKGEVNLSGITKLILTYGYTVKFFNDIEKDELISQLVLSDSSIKSFTYCGDCNIIFIDNTLSNDEKVFLLLHECGHIVCEHIGHDQIHLLDKETMELEANAFAKYVLNLRYPSRRYLLTLKMLVISLFALCIFLSCVLYYNTRNNEVSDTVSITLHGEKYHRSSCYTIKNSDTIDIPKHIAQKIYDPCGICNP